MASFEDLPQSEVLLDDTSLNDTLGIKIWRDPTPCTESMRLKNLGSMGLVRIYDKNDGVSISERRVALLEKFGAEVGLTEKEETYWFILVNYLPDEAIDT